MTSCSCGLYAMDKGSNSINCTVFRSGPKLGHGEEGKIINIVSNALGDDLFQKLARALHECNWAVRFGNTVIGFLGFVNYDHGGMFLQVDAVS